MRLSRIYTDQPLSPGAAVELRGPAVTYLTRVLRLAPDAPLILFNGTGGEYAATFDSATRAQVRCLVRSFDPIEREASLPMIVLQGIARGDRMDAIVQKCTELGVAHLLPLASERSVVRASGEAGERKRAHWLGVAISACEQCGRNRIPRIDAPLAPDAAFVVAQTSTTRLLLDPEAPMSLAECCAQAVPGEPLALLVGPEGGLSEGERELARHAGFSPCHLGARVLRTETATLTALSVVHALLGDFRRSP